MGKGRSISYADREKLRALMECFGCLCDRSSKIPTQSQTGARNLWAQSTIRFQYYGPRHSNR